MIQINLLPDVKREYLRSQQTKHFFIVISALVSVTMVALLVVLFMYVQFFQPHHRTNVQHDIDSSISELKNKQNAVKIVTVQGALEQLPALKDKQLVTSRLFDYLKGFTPRDVAYSQVTFDTVARTLTIQGQTTTYEEANVLANNLKSAKFTYTKADSTSTITPFSSIVFGSLNKSTDNQTNRPVSFEISFQIDLIMFDQGISNTSIKVDASSDKLLLPADSKPFSDTAPAAPQPPTGSTP